MNPGAGTEMLEDLPKAAVLHQYWSVLHCMLEPGVIPIDSSHKEEKIFLACTLSGPSGG